MRHLRYLGGALFAFSLALGAAQAASPTDGEPAPVDLSAAKSSLADLGFSCDEPSAARGLVCRCDPATACHSFPAFPRTVALVIPPGYRETPDARLVLYFHGNDIRSPEQLLTQFGLPEGLALSGRNAILVLPVSPGIQDKPALPNTADLANADHFKGFIDAVSRVANEAGLALTPEFGSIALAAHSGGCYPAAVVLKHGIYGGQINELFLIDAMYPPTPDTFEVWAENPVHRLWSSYTDHNFKDRNERVRKAVDRPEGTCAYGDWQSDRSFPSPQVVATKRCGFLHVGPDGALHEGQVPDVFRRFLVPASSY